MYKPKSVPIVLFFHLDLGRVGLTLRTAVVSRFFLI